MIIRPALAAFLLTVLSHLVARSAERATVDIVSLELSPVMLDFSTSRPEAAGPSAFLRAFTFNWSDFSVSMIEAGVGSFIYSESYDDWMDGGYVFAGTEFGYSLRFSESGRHRLTLGLGVGGLHIAELDSGQIAGFGLSPTLRYEHETEGNLLIGASLRSLLPMQTTLFGGHGRVYRSFVIMAFSLGVPVQREVEEFRINKGREVEWFRISVPTAWIGHSTSHGDWGGTFAGFGSGFTLSAPRLRWDYVTWTTFELGILLANNDPDETYIALFAGSVVGMPVVLDDDGRHEVAFSLGFDFGTFGFENGEYGVNAGGVGLAVCPMAGYGYLTESGLVLGIGLRAFLEAITDSNHSAAAFIMTLDVGYR